MNSNFYANHIKIIDGLDETKPILQVEEKPETKPSEEEMRLYKALKETEAEIKIVSDKLSKLEIIRCDYAKKFELIKTERLGKEADERQKHEIEEIEKQNCKIAEQKRLIENKHKMEKLDIDDMEHFDRRIILSDYEYETSKILEHSVL